MKYSLCLTSGLGNMILSLIGFYHTLRVNNIDPYQDGEILEWQDKVWENGMLFGGHPRGNDRHLGDIFPKINYKFVKKSLEDDDTVFTLQFSHDGYDAHNLEKMVKDMSDDLTQYFVLFGWFFNNQYRSKYREEILDWLEFGDCVKNEVSTFFQNNMDPSTSVSFHVRMGSIADTTPMPYVTVEEFTKGLSYIKKVHPNMKTLLVCSENKERFEKYYNIHEIMKELDMNYVFYDSDIENCLYAMLECAHHLLSHSTLSYTVLYMDKKYPDTSLVITAPFSYLPTQMILSDEMEREAQTSGLMFYSQL